MLNFRLFNFLKNWSNTNNLLNLIWPFKIILLLLFDELFVLIDFVSFLQLLVEIWYEMYLAHLQLLYVFNFILDSLDIEMQEPDSIVDCRVDLVHF